jgi:adenylate kinase family enzyme
MREDIEKVLVYIGRVAAQVPSIQAVIGYLLSDPSRVRFVESLDQNRQVAMAMSLHRRIELPMAPWQGYIRSVPVPDPLTWIQAARVAGGEIAVRVSSDDLMLRQLLAPLVEPERARQQRLVMTDRMKNLRQELDRALDLYNEVRHLMEVDQERQQELEKFLTMAEQEMQNMGRELTLIKERLSEGEAP